MGERAIVIRNSLFDEAVRAFMAAARVATENGCRCLVPNNLQIAEEVVSKALAEYLTRPRHQGPIPIADRSLG